MVCDFEISLRDGATPYSIKGRATDEAVKAAATSSAVYGGLFVLETEDGMAIVHPGAFIALHACKTAEA